MDGQKAVLPDETGSGEIDMPAIHHMPAGGGKVYTCVRGKLVYLLLNGTAEPLPDGCGVLGKIPAAVVQRGEVQLVELIQRRWLTGDARPSHQDQLEPYQKV